LSSLEPPSEVYYRQFDQIDGDFLSFGSQHPENVAFKKELARKAKSKSFNLTFLRKVVILRDETIDTKKATPHELFSYLGLGDIESGTGNIIGYRELPASNIFSKSCVFYKGDIVFGRLRPYLNKVHLVKVDKAIGSTELYVVITDRNRIDPEFLVRYLLSDLTLTQTKWILTGSSYPRLAKDDFLDISVIVPNIESGVQEKIVKEVSKLENEAMVSFDKAAILTKDAYELVPQNLSINVPAKTDYDFYAVPIDQLRDRLDFNFNNKEYRELSKEISKSPFAVKFGEILDEKKGLTNGVEIRKFVEEGSPYLRVSDVIHNKLNLEEVARVDAKLSDLTKNIKLEYDNLVISRSGTLGIVLLVDEKFPVDELILSSHLIRVVLKDSIDGRRIDPRFVLYFLRSNVGQMQFNQVSSGSSVPEVSQSLLSDMKIIIPDNKVQSNMVSRVDAKVNETSKHEALAEQKWAESKRKFVDLLLNQDSVPIGEDYE